MGNHADFYRFHMGSCLWSICTALADPVSGRVGGEVNKYLKGGRVSMGYCLNNLTGLNEGSVGVM